MKINTPKFGGTDAYRVLTFDAAHAGRNAVILEADRALIRDALTELDRLIALNASLLPAKVCP